MASYIQGYDEERFVITISQNFLCLICFNVLKDPVLCPRNQHCFCRGCITKHLENSRRCPTCADELTEETLTEPPRMVKDYLNELNIRCVYHDRGCEKIVQLQHLDQHEDSCGFTPAVCRNQGCGAILNKRDLIHHESELCEYRKMKCHSCEKIIKTLADVEKRTERIETNQAIVEKNMETKFVDLEKNIETKLTNVEKNLETYMGNNNTTMKNNTARMDKRIANMETKMVNMKTDIEEKLEAVNNEVKGLKTALVESFDRMKDVLVKMENNIKENAKKVRNAHSGDRENIIVVGGWRNDSVEMFNWRLTTWSPLQSLPKKRRGATSFVYNNQLVIAGGWCDGIRFVDNMIKMNADPHPDLSKHWSDCHNKLPVQLAFHSSVLYNDKLMVTGGYDGNATSDKIHEMQFGPSYNSIKTLSTMPEPRQEHCTEIFDDSLLILGRTTTAECEDNLSSVVLYDIKNNVCKQLKPLPYEVSEMATVRWGDNVVVLGGCDKHNNALNTVVMYNVTTEQNHMLPSMIYKRGACTAVVVENNIVVLGGVDEQWRALKSVEVFNFKRNTWQELPEMSQARYWHTAVVV